MANGVIKLPLSIVGPLWTNPNPTSDFAAQTLSLDLSGYDMLLVYAWDTVGDVAPVSYIIEAPGTTFITAFRDFTNSNAIPMTYRKVTITGAGITFGNGTYKLTNQQSSPATRNDFRVPTKIYGIKGIVTP